MLHTKRNNIPDQYSSNLSVKNKEHLRNCHSQEETKKTCMTTKCDMVSWKRKKTLHKNEGNLDKLWTSVSNSVLILVH